jgi:hypothetical protein
MFLTIGAVILYMLDKRYNADTPSKAPEITVTTTPPTGRTETKGPFQEGGSVSAIEVGSRVMLDFLHAAE